MAAQVSLLGDIEITGVDDASALTRRDRVVLGALAVLRGEPVSIDQLADALWGDDPPPSATKVIQGSVMRLRRALGAVAIVTSGSGYRFALDGDAVDTQVFERRVARARDLAAAHEPTRAAASYEQALAMWRGRPVPELVDWDPGRAEAERLLEVRRAVEEELVEARMQCGRTAEAVADARALVAREPHREHRWALLSLALYRSGRQREALDALRRARRTLLDDLGLDPGPELAELEGRILRQDPTLLDVPAAPDAASSTCPWPGLRPFDADVAELFAGREDDVATCLARLEAVPLLVVVGASGSGKSSLVLAGVVPVLLGRGDTVAVLTPGVAPAAALSGALTSGDPPDVVVIDQLEELFTAPRTPDVAPFLGRIGGLVESGTRVIITLRADYVAELSADPAFARLAERGLALLAPMSEAQLRRAIEVPAAHSGLVLEHGLVDLLVRDVVHEAGGLPLMSHALAETWSRREGAVLTVDAYTSTGGIRGAVAQSAERLYESLGGDDRAALRGVLHRLVTPTTTGDPVAARVPTRVFDGNPDAPRLLDLLVRARLVTASADTATIAHESLVRAWPRLRTWLDEDVEGQRVLAHLQVAAEGWHSANRPDDELYRGARLSTAVEWRDRAEPMLSSTEREFLQASAAYAESEEQRRSRELAAQKRTNRQLRWSLGGVAALLVLSLVAGTLATMRGREAQASAGAARSAATKADAASLSAASRAEMHIDLALLEAQQAVQDDPSTERQADVLAAVERAGVLSTVEADPDLTPVPRAGDALTKDGTRYVASNWDKDVVLVDTATGSSIGQPLATVERNYGNLSSGAGFYDGDTKVAAMVGQEAGGKSLRRFDARTGAPLGPAEPVPGARSDDFWHQDMLHIAPDGRILVSFLDERVRVWTYQDGQWRGPRIITPPAFPPSAGEQFLERVTFSDDSRVASVTLDHAGPPHWATQISWAFDLKSGVALSPWVLDSKTVAIAPDGRSWALAREVDGSAALETRPLPENGTVVTVPLPLDAMAQSVAWSPDSRYLGYGAANGAVAVYDTRPPTPSSITRRDLVSRLDLAEVRAFPGDGRAVGAMAVTTTGRVVTVQLGVRINVRSMRGDTALLTIAPTEDGPVAAVAAGAAGTVVAGGLDSGLVVVLDQGTMTPVRRLSLGPYPPPVGSMAPAARMRVTAIGVSPDGATVVAGNRSGALRVWRVSDGATVWSTMTTPVEQLAVSPDGRWLATLESTIDPEDRVARAHPDGVPSRTWFRLRDLRTGAEVFSELVLDQDGNVPKGKMLQFSPDSRLVAAPFLNPSLVAVYRVERPALLWQAQDQPIESTFGPIAVAFTPDSSTLLVRTESGASILAFDPWTGMPVDGAYREPGDAGYGNLGFSGDGRWLFSRTPLALSVYDTATKHLLTQGLSVADNLGEGSMAVLPDGYLYAATASGVARLDVDPLRWSASACRLAGRQLTEQEWAQLLPARPYAPACGSGGAAIPG